jgi:hypothetical protein
MLMRLTEFARLIWFLTLLAQLLYADDRFQTDIY